MNKMMTFTSLMPHQKQAYDKLIGLKVGALYMEMGTGKTRTALEIIKTRLNAGKIDAVIWLCPCSVKTNLLFDIRKHSNLADLNGVLDICGIETLSTSVRENIRLLKVAVGHKAMLIVDESSLVKNHAALRSVHITSIAERCPYRMILNGTPVSKNEADLYSQWYILDWRILGYPSYWSFAANHLEIDDKGRIRRALNVDYLAEKMAPYTYQCKKSDCFVLPPKKICKWPFYMTPEQDENYDYVIKTLLTDLEKMCAESIYRLFGALQSVVSGFAVHVNDDFSIAKYPLFPDPKDNPRIKILLKIIDDEKDKIIIYCTYTYEIDTICQILNDVKPGSAVPFNGDIPQKRRQANIEKFRGPAQFFVTNKACGAYGLNLQFCHKIIYYSHDWDWGTRAQSEDRVHRYGQTEPVLIQEIYASNSIDEQILKCLERKENLVNALKHEIKKKNISSFLRGGKIENLQE